MNLVNLVCYSFQAYKQGLYGPSYVWILTGSTLQGGWIRETQGCSLEQVQAATNGHLVLLSQEASQSRYATISGRVRHLFLDTLAFDYWHHRR